MPDDITRTPAGGQRRAAARAAPRRPPERAQLVWQRALEMASSATPHDRSVLALELLRAAHHSPSTVAHALNLGRTHDRARSERASGGVAILEAAIAFLGTRPRADDIGGTAS